MSNNGSKEFGRCRWMLAGFCLASALPMLYGLYGLTSDWLYTAALNPPPNTARCGLGTLAGLGLIFVVGPVCGFFGAVCGYVMGLFDDS